MSRTAYQLQIRVVKDAADGVIHSNTIRGTADDTFDAGALLTLKANGRAATLATTIDSQISDPVKYLALAEFEGDATETVAVEEIKPDTILVGQISTGTATYEDIGSRGYLVQDATTGNYAVNITSDTYAVVEIVDTEENVTPFAPNAASNYNLVWFKFLEAALEKAPQAAS